MVCKRANEVMKPPLKRKILFDSKIYEMWLRFKIFYDKVSKIHFL